MGHHSYLVIGDYQFLYTRNHYNPELAALFSEDDRRYTPATEPSDEEWVEDGGTFGYFTTAHALRQRLQVQGFTTRRAHADAAQALAQWRAKYDAEYELRERQEKEGADDPFTELTRKPRELGDLLTDIGSAIGPHQPIGAFDTLGEYWTYETRFAEAAQDVDRLHWETDTRSVIRLLIDQAPDDTVVGLDLSALTGCCVHLDPSQPIAGPTRRRQLASLPTDAPVIVLTEGSTDSRLLTKAMHITHPHLDGFIRFIDYSGSGAEGNVSALGRMVKAFIAAGVANRFVAIADNDTAAHTHLAELKSRQLPEGCRLLHYPELPLLTDYPVLYPTSSETTRGDVNGIAGSLEMYLGRDVLTIDGSLAPVHLAPIPGTKSHQGALSQHHKRRVQKAFDKKVKRALNGQPSDGADWSGVHAIIESIVHAFD
ncbi:HEPN/Toprim-associated domain-containing protein [Streptomyces olivaceoviridis]|uniref:HEPN/Toprim-associated domain-containing protein n=1 Tax=Streptomyces olivaceoviridis TaxID=1921 RepID=UPI00367944DB